MNTSDKMGRPTMECWDGIQESGSKGCCCNVILPDGVFSPVLFISPELASSHTASEWPNNDPAQCGAWGGLIEGTNDPQRRYHQAQGPGQGLGLRVPHCAPWQAGLNSCIPGASSVSSLWASGLPPPRGAGQERTHQVWGANPYGRGSGSVLRSERPGAL